MAQLDGATLRQIRESVRGEDQKTFLVWLNQALDRRYDLPRLSRWEKGSEKIPAIVGLCLRSHLERLADQAGDQPADNSSQPPLVTGAKPVAADKPVKEAAKPGLEISKPGAVGGKIILRGHRPAQIIAVANHKGGVGKTTTSVNIAWGLVAAGLKVLVIDIDPQSDATLHLGFDREEIRLAGHNMAAVMRGQCDIQDTLLQYDDTNLWIVPSSKDLTEAEKEVASAIGGERRLAQRIAGLRDLFDVILFDCGPNKNLFTINSLSMAHYLVVPVQTEYLAVQGMLHLLDTVTQVRDSYNPDLKILPVLPTMYAPRNSQDRATLEELHELVSSLVPIYEPVPRATVFGQAAAAGHPALRAKPRAKAVTVYGDYVRMMLGELSAAITLAVATGEENARV